jgi:hypothetical protein
VIQFDKKARKVQVSIKALEVAEEKEAIAAVRVVDSGATLGDILGKALKAARRSVSFSDQPSVFWGGHWPPHSFRGRFIRCH